MRGLGKKNTVKKGDIWSFSYMSNLYFRDWKGEEGLAKHRMSNLTIFIQILAQI